MKQCIRSRWIARTVIFCLMASGGGVCTYGDSDPELYWDRPDLAVPNPEDVAFTFAKTPHAKNESVFVMGYFNDGWVFMFSLFHIDSKVLDRWGMYALVADPTGRKYWRTVTPDEKDIDMADGSLAYNDGVNVLRNDEDTFIMSCSFDGFACNLRFEKRIDEWTPGSGTEIYGDDGTYQYKAVFAPLADLTGTITVDDLQIEVKGEGYAEKTLFVNPLARQQPYLHALRLYGDAGDADVHIGIHQVVLHKAYNNREIKRLVVARDDTWVITTQEYQFEPTGYARLESSPYEYPSSFRLTVEENGYRIDGKITQRLFFDTTDVFANLPTWVRKILTVFFKRPVFYRYVAELEGKMTYPDGTVRPLRLSGPYEYVVVY